MTSHTCTRKLLRFALAALLLVSVPVKAQVTTGTIYGVITDPDGRVLPGVVVNAVSAETGIPRTATSATDGTYRFPVLPRGTYKVTTELSGFSPTVSDIDVAVSANVPLNLKLRIANLNEEVTVTANMPLSSARALYTEVGRLWKLPTNGGHIATFIALEPGVGGPGFHPDSSRASQPVFYANGFGGRSGNVQFDGGDNIDATVGGFSQPIPLEAIQQYSFLANGFDAQHGRGSSVLNIITKSGTNQASGSWFTFFRDDALNAQTFSEKTNGVEKQPYNRMQYGGSFGGPVVRNLAHFFAAVERTQQDKKQVVDTGNTLPGDGTYDVPFRQNLFTGKLTVAPSARHYLAVRYAHDKESQPSGITGNTAAATWAMSTNTYHSLNVNYNVQTGRTAANEFVFQVSNYLNDTPANQPGPSITLLSGAKGGANANAPQTTEQQTWQFRNDFSWSNSLFGSSHQFRTGVNVLHTPRLYITSQGGTQGILTLRSNDINGGVDQILLIGGNVSSNIPTDLYGVYVQDDWRVTNRLTLNLGVRYDYLSGIPIDQTSTNFLNMQAAGLTGRFEGTFLEDFGKSPRGDRNNIQPRLGGVYDLRGDGRSLLRGGWGIYTDTAYTNSNVLTASLEGGGIIFAGQCRVPGDASPWCNPDIGFTYQDGTLYTGAQSALTLDLPTITPTAGEAVSPRLQQPFTYQTSLGWSHEIDDKTTFTVDYVKVQGRNINMRIRPNVDTDPSGTTLRYLAGVGVSPNSNSFRTTVSGGRSEYDALIFDVRRRMGDRWDLDASYTLSESTSHVGTAADELTQNLLQDVNDPFSDFQLGPSTRVDARHRVTASAIVRVPYDVQLASTVIFRTALPTTTIEGVDFNGDGVTNDHTPLAYHYTGLNADGSATFEEAGACETVNCSRRAPFSQVNLRVSRSFRLLGPARIEAMLEVFNVFNAKNPSIPLSMMRNNNAFFMQPTAFAGDVGQGEQRLAQIGARLTF